jgi:NAD(P)-dependent dehydrogenase (short-subunit alcohol dehydrogenase family)
MKTVLILGLTSDIGRELALRYRAAGWNVAGTHRSGTVPAGLPADCTLLACDFADRASVDRFGRAWAALGRAWDVLVVAVGTEEPIGPFLDCDPDDWERCLDINAVHPLRALRALLPSRRPDGSAAVAFFSGSGTNSPAPAYSGYAAAKILLIKMCELLDAEVTDTNFFIIGPGIVRTKIHQQTLNAPERSGRNHAKVVEFLDSGNPGTSHDDIHTCIDWCVTQGRRVVGGRNLSLVHDAWRRGGQPLANYLLSHPDAYKLRRRGNEIILEQGTA